MKIHVQLLGLSVACVVLGALGYQTSVVRAGGAAASGEVLASAGDSGFFSASEATEGGEDYRISALNVFSNVVLHVKDNYVNPERIEPKEMLVASLNEIERQVAEVLVEDAGAGKLRVKVLNNEKIVHIDDVESLWEINLKLREVFRFFEKNLPPQKDMRAIEYAAVNGALSTLDPHSVLLRPEAFAEMKTSTKGEFGGLGIVISIRDGKLTIMTPLDGTPASRVGLLAGDVISRIGEVSTVSMPIEEAVNLLRGPEGSKVAVWVERKGWPEPRKFMMTRERIKIESVEGSLLSENVGYIKIKNFQQNTGKDLEDKLTTLSEQAGGKLKGLVLDLRNNPGGLLEQAIRVSDKFLTSGDIVTTVGYGNKLREPKKARWSGTESELPIAVLVNNGSASASEIVAGALKNLDRAVTIGERTFGKGSVQVLYDFADNSALKLTIAQYLTPGGISIQNVGVTPDIELKQAFVEANAPVRLFYEPEMHRENSLDKHLDRASEGSNEAADKEAVAKLTYLLEKGAPAADPEEETPTSKLEEDFPVRLAREVLLAAGNASRAQTLKNATEFLEKRKQEEATRIQTKLGSLGIDWSDAPKGSEAGAKAEVEMRLLGSEGERVLAGAEVKIEATVKNTGKAPLYRLRGVIDSEHPAFKGREFLFGKVGPGETRNFTVTTKISKDASSRSDILKLKLESVDGPRPEDLSLAVVTRHVAHPAFAYTYIYDDTKRGDADGVLEMGEGVDLVVFVTNTGDGDADEVSLRLKSGAGEDLFLERGRAELGKIKAGETRSGRLRFKVPKTQSTRDGLPVELTIWDQGTQEWMEDQFSLALESRKLPNVAKARGGVTAKKDVLLLSAPYAQAQVIASLPKGARLATSGKAGEYVRVDLDEEAYGWALVSDTKAGARPKAGASKGLTFHPRRRAPTIALETELGESVVDRDEVTLAGQASGRQIRDLYVLLNDEKIYFAGGPQPREEAPSPTWAPPKEDAVNVPFRLSLKLKEGLNRVLIVARLDEKVVTYRTLFVSRRGAVPNAVAEAGGVDTKKNKPAAP